MSTRTSVTTAAPRFCPHSTGRLFLPRTAYDIMEDYFFRHSQWPDRRARVELARRVNAVLRCCCYSAQHVYMRFAYLRRREKIGMFPAQCPSRPGSRARMEEMRTGEATGSHSVVAKLDVLLDGNPSPTPAVAAIWADVLAEGVLAEDIITYALLRQVKRHMGANESKRGLCPVAAQTSTPSPANTTSSTSGLVVSQEQSPSTLPMGPRSPQERKQRWGPPIRPTSLSSPALHGKLPPTESRPSSAGTPCTLPAETQELAAELRHALSAPATPHPKTFSELCTWIRGSVSTTAI